MSRSQPNDLRDAIADALRSDGSYVEEVAYSSPQAVVDAQWAAHLAAREVGTRVRVGIGERRPAGGPAQFVILVTPRSP